MKKIICVPSGRKRYMSIQFEHILKARNYFDEYRIWLNTKNEEDIAFLYDLKANYNFVTIDDRAIKEKWKGLGTNNAIGGFFNKCCDLDSLYLRIDDDVVWFEDRFFERMFSARSLDNEHMLIYPNIVNNACIDFLRKKKRGILNHVDLTFNCACENGWKNGKVCYEKHLDFLEKIENSKISDYKMDNFTNVHHNRISINSISWLGKDFSSFNGLVPFSDEEEWLSSVLPKQKNKPNLIIGDILCSHFAFFTQRGSFNEEAILNRYRNLSQNV